MSQLWHNRHIKNLDTSVWSPEATQTARKKQKIAKKNKKVPKSPKFSVDFVENEEMKRHSEMGRQMREAFIRADVSIVDWFYRFLSVFTGF